VLHGYGQLADYFIRKFEVLNNGKNFIVAPEGLSRFYVKGHAGRVGASWMTKEERLQEIEDYVNYLDALYHHLHIFNKKIIVLGFSQGAATASRWVATSKQLKNPLLVLYGSVFPPDFPFQQQTFKHSPLLVYGNNDEFIHENDIRAHIDFLMENKITPKVIRYEGKHDIYPEVLLKINNTVCQNVDN
jgi:predicted esterase